MKIDVNYLKPPVYKVYEEAAISSLAINYISVDISSYMNVSDICITTKSKFLNCINNFVKV